MHSFPYNPGALIAQAVSFPASPAVLIDFVEYTKQFPGSRDLAVQQFQLALRIPVPISWYLAIFSELLRGVNPCQRFIPTPNVSLRGLCSGYAFHNPLVAHVMTRVFSQLNDKIKLNFFSADLS